MNNDMTLRTTIVSGDAQTGATRPLALSDLAAERQEKLPRDFPRQAGDSLGVSAQARQLAGGQNAEVGALSFWDHGNHSTPVGQRSLEVDPSGSYRLD